MDKCIEVLIPTGEVRLINDGKFYIPADEESRSRLIVFCDGWGDIVKAKNDKWRGQWVSLDDGCIEMLFPVIAQYGDEFPA